MEKIEALVNVLGMFAAELGNVKDLISDIQDMVLKQTTDLKEELASFKQSLKKNEASNEAPKATNLSETEEELKKRIHKLKIEIGRLKIQKREKEAALLNDNSDQSSCKNSVNGDSKPTSVADSLADSLTRAGLESPIGEANVTEAKIWKPTWMNGYERGYESDNLSSLPSPTVVAREVFAKSEKNKRENSSAQPVEWWKEISKLKRADEYIDWKKEYAERKDIKNNLMVKEGWKCKNPSHKELEDIFAMWMGKSIKYTVLRRFREKTGKALFNVKFENMEDRKKVYDMRQKIGEEGYLLIGEEYSNIERKERWTMLMMSERLSLEGKMTVFDNRRICVDDEWWTYDWVDGWKRV